MNGARPDLGYGPVGDRTQLTNEQAAVMNPQGRITAVRQPNGTLGIIYMYFKVSPRKLEQVAAQMEARGK